ncbi:hypothetical protein FEM21_16900 [Flavobacterium seoulense]|uniref:Uncharacterized protein n=1 Tax=Flavobacterium seoulense TaxID=1492738 RepID=A0A066WVW3_9FLAO|nr:hypothetical protein FEM21_16900 [Flavobacterium seoulense]
MALPRQEAKATSNKPPIINNNQLMFSDFFYNYKDAKKLA